MIYSKNGNFNEDDIESATLSTINKWEGKVMEDIANMEGQLELRELKCGSFDYNDKWVSKVTLAIKMQQILLKKIEHRRMGLTNFYVNFYDVMKNALQEKEFTNALKITNERIFGRPYSRD